MIHASEELRVKRRVALLACVAAVFLFATLLASIEARNHVQLFFSEYLPPFASAIPENGLFAIALAAIVSILIGVLFYMFLAHFSGIDARLRRISSLRFLGLQLVPRDTIRASLIILAFWAPIIVVSYPTGITVDTFNQLYQYQTHAPTLYQTTGEIVDAELIDHHPVFDTLLYGLFWSLGSLVGNQGAGLFVLVVLQSLVLSVELGYSICYMQKLRVPYAVRLAMLVFVAWFPYFGHYAATVLKDVTYLTFFLPWFLLWMEAARTKGSVFGSTRYLVAFMVLGGFCILSKKLGAFIFIPCVVVLAMLLRQYCARLLAGTLAALLIFGFALPWCANAAFGPIAPGGKQEILAPAIQQSTLLARENIGTYSEEDLEAISKVVDLEKAIDDFEIFRADGAKNHFRQAATTSEIIAYLRVWFAKGVEHPLDYARSVVGTTGMLYVPFSKLDYYSYEDLSQRSKRYSSINPEFNVVLEKPEFLVSLDEYFRNKSPESAVSNLPFVSLFFTTGFYGGWIPVFAFLACIYVRLAVRSKGIVADNSAQKDARKRSSRRPYTFLGLLPIALAFASLFVCPVASPRYVLPILFALPLIVGWVWDRMKLTVESAGR